MGALTLTNSYKHILKIIFQEKPHTQTSLVANGLKKQSISLRRLQTRLLSRDMMTSFTDVRTNVMETFVKKMNKSVKSITILYILSCYANKKSINYSVL